MSHWEELFGTELLTNASGGKASTTSLLNGKRVGIYFSAHWCPPCRRFTPLLADYYTKSRSTDDLKDIEIVFCSSDRDEGGFKNYFGTHPWKAVPFGNDKVRQALGRKFGVEGIPCLVTLDPQGNIMSKKGVQQVVSKSDALWLKPKPLWEELKAVSVVDGAGKKTSIPDIAKNNTVVGLYFSAHWCGPCRAFTPELASAYKELKKAGKKFEIIFCSSDKNGSAFSEYFASMPWKALPFSERALKESLSERFDVQGIPTLVLVDSAGKVITDKGRGYIEDLDDFPWTGPPKPLLKINSRSLDNINQGAVLMAIFASKAEEQKARSWLDPLAQSYVKKFGSGDPPLVFLTGSDHELIPRVMGFLNITSKPALLITNLPEQAKFLPQSSAVNADSVKAFVDAFLDPAHPGLKKLGPRD